MTLKIIVGQSINYSLTTILVLQKYFLKDFDCEKKLSQNSIMNI